MTGGVHGLFCLGTIGEFYALTGSEKLEVVEATLDAADNSVPLYAQTGGIATADVIRLTKAVQDRGVAAVSVVTPNQAELEEHFLRIADGSHIPIILYTIPSRTGVRLEPDTVAARCGRRPGHSGSSGCRHCLPVVYSRGNADPRIRCGGSPQRASHGRGLP
jgi:4-hydroxy-tetrahydrodipicolinate synthase